MILTGNDLRYESTLELQRQVYEGAAGPKYLVEIEGTYKLLVSEAYEFNANLSAAFPKENLDNFDDKERVYMTYSAAFLDMYLKGNEAKRQVLCVKSPKWVTSLKYED